MSGFSKAWLALREPADHRARHDFLATGATLGVKRVVDLACGTGSNFRYLAPRLAPVQHWTCIDHDADLLAAFAASLETPAGRAVRSTVELRCADLGAGIEPADLEPGALLCASALLDLVSDAWIAGVVADCAAARVPALFALSYDGRMRCAPEDPFDRLLRAAINRHQRRDKGFGPALGPDAATRAAAAFATAGFGVELASSDWRIDGSEAALQRALIDGWVDAAREIDDSPELERWRRRRIGEIERDGLAIVVGHVDVLAIPSP